MDKWKYLKTEETIIGMNEEADELKKINVFCCPKCGYKATEWQLEHSEFNRCPKCGNKNEYDGGR